MGIHTAVGPVGDLHPFADGAGEAFLGIAGRLPGLLELGGRQRAALTVGQRRGRGEQGRDVIGAALLVEPEGLVVGEGPMLDRVDPGAQCGVDAVDAMGMD